MFACVSHFLISLIFVSKAWSLPLEESHVRGSTLVSSSLACKCQKTREEMTNIGRHSSLLRCSKSYCSKKFRVQALGSMISMENFLFFQIAIAGDAINMLRFIYTQFGSSDFAEQCNFNRNSPIFSNCHCWR